MRARPGSTAFRRARTATSRRSTTIASIGSSARIPISTSRINGGIASVEQAAAHLAHVDGVMMGRAAYQEPWRLLAVDPLIFGAPAPFASPKAALEAFIPYVERELARGTRLHSMTRHILGLFHGVPGARAFRRHHRDRSGASPAPALRSCARRWRSCGRAADLAHIAA